MLRASEHRCDVVSVRNDSEDYVRTLEDYVRTLGERLGRLRRNCLRAEGMLGEAPVGSLERCLGAATDALANRYLGLIRIIFERA